MIQRIIEPKQKSDIAEAILTHLPEWFGVPESTRAYIDGVADKPFWADMDGDAPRGFIALRETSPDAAEKYVMGVLPAYHRSGSGRALYNTLEAYAKQHGYSFVQVKTVRKGVWESYDRTNEFYIAMGFRELECFPTFWDEKNPCQIYIKAI